jgi:hypothetical protein
MAATRSVKQLNLQTLRDTFAVARLALAEPVPEWARMGSFSSLTRTEGELSIVCPEANVPVNVTCERGLKCLRVAGPVDFSMVGILASLLDPLAAAGVAVFVISTFDTDYLFVKARDFEHCMQALGAAGHHLTLDDKSAHR